MDRNSFQAPLFSLLISVLVTPTAGVAEVRATTASPNRPTLEAPFEISSNKPFVRVGVNGSAPRLFILDTGCRISSLIGRTLAEDLGMKLVEQESDVRLGGGEGKSLNLASTMNVTLDFHGDTLQAPELPVVSLDHLMPYEGRRVEGLLGGDFMERHIVELDYAHSTLRLYDPQTYRYAGTTPPIPITLDDGLARAKVRLVTLKGDTIDSQVVVDTGIRGTVIWYRPFVEEHKLLESQEHYITGTIGGGMGGETRGDIGRLTSLTIGPLTLSNPTAIFSRDTTGAFSGTDAAGIMGGEVLRRCKVTFDYPHLQLMLEPYPDQASLEYDMSGLFLVADPPDLKQVRIQSVAEGTPASEAGLLKGDQIVTIDDRKTDTLTLDQVREMFKVKGKAYRLGVARAERSFSVRIELRRLV